MPSIKDLKTRIASVKNTQQTTRAMKLVSAAKLRRAQESIVNNRPYARKVGELIELVSSMSDTPLRSILLRGEEALQDKEKKVLLVLVTSDRGLCGGFNSSITKRALLWEAENRSKYASIQFAFIGKKGFEFFKTRNYPAVFSKIFGRSVSFEETGETVKGMIDSFIAGEFHEIRLIYNEFKNAMVQGVVVERFLPVTEKDVNWSERKISPDLFIVKPSHEEVLNRLLEKHFTIQAYRIFLESQASEHGARMVAMENATKNAGEMIRDLTLQFNKQRQAGITKELLEIISGSESQKQS